mgnify:CR=1 FL=1
MVSKQSASRAKQNNAKKSPAKQPQQKKTTAKKHPFIAALVKVILIGLLIIIIPWVGIPLTLSVIFNITEQSQSKGVQEQMVQSLQERYHEEFIVEKPKLKGASIDTRGVWEATAYPTKNKEYAITVEKATIFGRKSRGGLLYFSVIVYHLVTKLYKHKGTNYFWDHLKPMSKFG